MEQPKNQDPAEWAEWNEWNKVTARIIAERMGLDSTPELTLEPFEIKLVELPPACADLTLAVRRAASELHGESAKSDRIACQLLTALARFARETGT